MSDTPETDAAEVVLSPLEGDKWVRADIVRKLERERNMYQRKLAYLIERLAETQVRMITAELICHKIYIARNITLSEESMLSALAEIDKTYRTQNDGN